MVRKGKGMFGPNPNDENDVHKPYARDETFAKALGIDISPKTKDGRATY